MNGKANCSVAVVIMILFVAYSLQPAFADYLNKDDNVLADFLEKWAEYRSRGNASELVRYRNELIQAEKLKQERIKSTNGAVLQASEMSLLMDETYWYIYENLEYSPYEYDPWTEPPELIGCVDPSISLVV
jgi:hypothetical protein